MYLSATPHNIHQDDRVRNPEEEKHARADRGTNNTTNVIHPADVVVNIHAHRDSDILRKIIVSEESMICSK